MSINEILLSEILATSEVISLRKFRPRFLVADRREGIATKVLPPKRFTKWLSEWEIASMSSLSAAAIFDSFALSKTREATGEY